MEEFSVFFSYRTGNLQTNVFSPKAQTKTHTDTSTEFQRPSSKVVGRMVETQLTERT